MPKYTDEDIRKLNENPQDFLKKRFQRYLDFTNLCENSKNNLFDTLDKNYDSEVLKFVANLIDANYESQLVRCDFDNEYFEGDHRSDKLFIYGKGQLNLSSDLLLHHSPSDYFIYKTDEYDFDASNYSEHLNITNVDHYGGSFSFSGILKTYNGADYIEFGEAELCNEIHYYSIEYDSDVWCKYVLESYRFYTVSSFQTAYLMLFISLDSLIELIVAELMDFYQHEFQEQAIFDMKNYIYQDKYPVTEFINTCLIEDPLNKILIQLDNKKRKLIEQKLDQILELCTDFSKKQRGKVIKTLTFFEKVRNTLAHGNTINIKELKEEFAIAQKYIVDDEIKFDKLFIGLLIEIMKLLKNICGNIDVFEYKKQEYQKFGD